MQKRIVVLALAALLLPASVHAASARVDASELETSVSLRSAAPSSHAARGALTVWSTGSDPRCGRGRAWGCRRDDRWDRRYDRRIDRLERELWEREQWEREQFARARWERARYRARYGYHDHRFERYDGYAVACLRAGGRVFGATLVVCVP
jgi:hypothetical protein